MMWYWGGGVHWWAWLVGALVMVAFWVMVIWLAWYVISGVRGPGPDHDRRGDGAKRILDERLARGEIDADEYRRLRDLLREPHGGGVDEPARR